MFTGCVSSVPRYKYRTLMFLFVAGIYLLCNYTSHQEILTYGHRLHQVVIEVFLPMAPCAFGILYLFLALAIACDEYFSPAWDKLLIENCLDNLATKVAGATSVVAALILLRSLFDSFDESNASFGTSLVGTTAVFEIIFVIGICSLLSNEVVQLRLWSLFREGSYFAVSFFVLTIFAGVTALLLLLFSIYFGCVVIAYCNKEMYNIFSGKDPYLVGEAATPKDDNLKYNATLRAGFLTLISGDPESGLDKARADLVWKISNNIDYVIEYVDTNCKGEISQNKLINFFAMLEDEPNLTDDEIDMIIASIDSDGTGTVSYPHCCKFPSYFFQFAYINCLTTDYYG